MSYAREKLGLASLKLRGRGTWGEKLAGARSDLTAVFESDIPEGMRPLFLEVKAALNDGAGNLQDIASKLDQLASVVD